MAEVMSTMAAPMTISLASTGRNVIPRFKPNEIIQLHGKNGVGKSMAATMLEIASGNYVFESEGQFHGLKNAIEACRITIEAREGRERFEVKLTPGTWKFDHSLNVVNPLTIGTFHVNGKEIKHVDFKKKVNIRVIRGNESLDQQVTFFKDIFSSKVSRKIDAIENQLAILTKYKEAISADLSPADIKEYNGKQGAYNQLLSRVESLGTSIDNRKALLSSLKAQVPRLEDLLFILGHTKRDFPRERQEIQDGLDAHKAQLEKKVQEKRDLEDKLKELDSKVGKELQQWVQEQAHATKKLPKFKDDLLKYYDAEACDKLISADDQSATITFVKEQIETVERNLARAKRDFDQLNLNNKRVVDVNAFLSRLMETCDQVQGEPFATETIIHLDLAGTKASISSKDLKQAILASMQQFSENEQLKRYEGEVSRANSQINELKDKHKLLNQLDKHQKHLRALDQKIKGSGNTLADLVVQGQMDAIPKRIAELEGIIDDLNTEIHACKKKLDQIAQDEQRLSSMPSEHVIISELHKLNCVLKDTTLDACSKRLSDVRKDINREEIAIENSMKEQQDIEKKFHDAKQLVDEMQEKIRQVGKKYNFSKLGEFVVYYTKHLENVARFETNLKSMQSKLQSLLKDIDAVVNGKAPRVAKNGEIIIAEFDSIFKEMYDRPEFFTYVFKEYTRIIRFDIKTRSVIFQTKTGMEESRELGQFSSGEKTYAYCRAIITQHATSAEFNIIILDESYALLDHEHSEDLYQFQREKIRDGSIAKFINILPLKEDIEATIAKLREDLDKERKLGNLKGEEAIKSQLEVQQRYLQEVQEGGYYQRVIPLA